MIPRASVTASISNCTHHMQSSFTWHGLSGIAVRKGFLKGGLLGEEVCRSCQKAQPQPSYQVSYNCADTAVLLRLGSGLCVKRTDAALMVVCVLKRVDFLQNDTAAKAADRLYLGCMLSMVGVQAVHAATQLPCTQAAVVSRCQGANSRRNASQHHSNTNRHELAVQPRRHARVETRPPSSPPRH